MSIYTSSTTRITGLSSGLDIDSLVDQLITAESTKYNRLQQNVQKAQWQQDAYRTIISKITEFQDKYFGSTSSSTNLRYSKAFSSYSSSVTTSGGVASSAVKVTSTSSSGTNKIKVNSVATSSSYKGEYNSFSAKSTVTSTKTLDEISESIDEAGSASFKVSYDGTSKEITISADELKNSSLGDVLNSKLEKAFGSNNGVANVSLVSTDGSDKMSLQYAGNGHTLTLSSGTISSDTSYTGSLSDNFTSKTLSTDVDEVSFTVEIDGQKYKVTADLSADEDDPLSASEVKTKISDALTTAVKVDDNGNETGETADISDVVSFTYSSSKGFTIKSASEDTGFTITDKGNLSDIMKTDGIEDIEYASTSTLSVFGYDSTNSKSYVSKSTDTLSDVLGITEDFTITINDVDITIDADATFAEMMSAINDSDAGVTLSYSTSTNSFTLESNSTGSASGITFGDSDTSAFFSQLGLSSDNYTAGADASVEINGVETTRASNTISLEGATVEITDDAVGEEFTITVENDVDAIYETIQSFVDDYNTLIEDLRSVVTETRTKYDDYTYYEPLTDAQKDEMDEDEIEKWETEAKKGILYNDSYIKNFLSSMRSTLYSTVTFSDGTTGGLYSFGITTTSDYTSGGKLEIDEDKLRSALENDLDKVQELFTSTSTGIADKLKSVTDSYVGTNGLLRQKAGVEGTSTQNDNILSNQIADLQEKMSAEKDRLTTKETNYYTLFSQMESAISQNNTEMDYIVSMLGS